MEWSLSNLPVLYYFTVKPHCSLNAARGHRIKTITKDSHEGVESGRGLQGQRVPSQLIGQSVADAFYPAANQRAAGASTRAPPGRGATRYRRASSPAAGRPPPLSDLQRHVDTNKRLQRWIRWLLQLTRARAQRGFW